MKTIYLAAALSLAAATTVQAGADPVLAGVPVVITSTITVSPSVAGVGDFSGGAFPIFFVITPPTTPGGSFTFRLVRG